MGMWHRLLGRLRRPDRRRYRRIGHPALRLRIDRRHYTATDWSLGGFRLRGLPETPRRGDRVSGTLGLGADDDGSFVGEVTNVGSGGTVGVRLLEIAPAVFVAMSGLKQI